MGVRYFWSRNAIDEITSFCKIETSLLSGRAVVAKVLTTIDYNFLNTDRILAKRKRIERRECPVSIRFLSVIRQNPMYIEEVIIASSNFKSINPFPKQNCAKLAVGFSFND